MTSPQFFGWILIFGFCHTFNTTCLLHPLALFVTSAIRLAICATCIPFHCFYNLQNGFYERCQKDEKIERVFTSFWDVLLKYTSFVGVYDLPEPFYVVSVCLERNCDMCIKNTKAGCNPCVFSGKKGGYSGLDFVTLCMPTLCKIWWLPEIVDIIC